MERCILNNTAKTTVPGTVPRSIACLLYIQADPRSTFASGTFFRGNVFPFLLIPEEQIFSYSQKMATKYL